MGRTRRVIACGPSPIEIGQESTGSYSSAWSRRCDAITDRGAKWFWSGCSIQLSFLRFTPITRREAWTEQPAIGSP